MLSQASGYAATALARLACAHGQALLVKEIAESADIPAPYLAKIIQTLARKRIVRTQRGIGGGVTLARRPEEITLLEVCESLDDPCATNRCMLGTDTCSDERACPCHDFWKVQRARFVEFLQRTTISDMAAFEDRRLRKQKRGANPIESMLPPIAS